MKKIAGWTTWSLAALLTVSGIGITGEVQAANSVSYPAFTGYSSIQGNNNWYYQQKNGTTYTDLTYQSASGRWDANGTYPWITSNAQHPGNQADAVRTWVAPGAYVPDDHSLSILDFGAIAGDNQPDDAAITAAIQQAKVEGKDVYVPAGNFELSDILIVDGVTLKGENKAQSILTSTTPDRGSIDLIGTSPAIRNLTHIYSSVSERDGTSAKNSISVKNATNFVVDSINVQKASTAGIYITDSIGGTITNNTVQNTQADGIHMTGDSSDITVQYNTVKQVGDDTIAVVSYGKSDKSSGDKGQTNNIRILNNDVGYDSNARGISVVGGRDVRIESNHIERTQMAGIYIATETGDNNDYNTQPVDSITINNNVVDRTALRPGGGHADMLVYAGYTAINDVTFNDNTSSNATKYSAGVWGRSTPQIGTVTFNNTTIINPKDPNQVYNFAKGTVYWNGVKVYPTSTSNPQ